MRWEQSLPPDLRLRKHRLKERSHLPQVTSEALAGPGLEFPTLCWVPTTCYVLSSAHDHHVPKETQRQDGLSVYLLLALVCTAVRCLELARLKTLLGPRHPSLNG